MENQSKNKVNVRGVINMNEEKLYLKFVRFVDDTMKEKDYHSSSFEDMLGYKSTISKINASILMIWDSYDSKSEYSEKFFKLHEKLDTFYESLKIREN